MRRKITIDRTGPDKEINIIDIPEDPNAGDSYSRDEANKRFLRTGTIEGNTTAYVEYTGINLDRSFMHFTKGENFNGLYMLGFSDDNSPNGYVFTYAHKFTHVFALHDHHPTAKATMHDYHQRSVYAPIDQYQALIQNAAPRTVYSVGAGVTSASAHVMYYGIGDTLDFVVEADGSGTKVYGNFRAMPNAGADPEKATFRIAGENLGFFKNAPVSKRPFPGWLDDNAANNVTKVNAFMAHIIELGLMEGPNG